jgi:hypothetical protein
MFHLLAVVRLTSLVVKLPIVVRKCVQTPDSPDNRLPIWMRVNTRVMQMKQNEQKVKPATRSTGSIQKPMTI